MLEKQIQAKIRKELIKHGWIVQRPISISKSGYPDLWALKDGRLVFVEVKQPGEQPTKLQAQRHKELIGAGFAVIIASDVKDIDQLIKSHG